MTIRLMLMRCHAGKEAWRAACFSCLLEGVSEPDKPRFTPPGSGEGHPYRQPVHVPEWHADRLREPDTAAGREVPNTLKSPST